MIDFVYRIKSKMINFSIFNFLKILLKSMKSKERSKRGNERMMLSFSVFKRYHFRVFPIGNFKIRDF